MAFVKMGLKPREFAEMDRFEKAVVIGFIKNYAENENKNKNKSKSYRKRK